MSNNPYNKNNNNTHTVGSVNLNRRPKKTGTWENWGNWPNSNNESCPDNSMLFLTEETERIDPHIPKTIKMSDLETRFGVELEVCVKISPDCIKWPKNIEPLSNPEYFDHTNSNKSNRLKFKEKFELFFNSIIFQSETFETIRDTYDFFVIDSGMSSYLYDMNDLFQEDGETLKSVGYSRLAKSNKSFWGPYSNYEWPIFREDCTIVCGDSLSDEKQNAGISDSLSFSFECITPIIAIEGQITPTKVYDKLAPMLNFFGLGQPQCFIENYSMGFHVNASVYDLSTRKYISIGEPYLINNILKTYLPVERETYSYVRSLRPLSKMGEHEYTSMWALPMYKSINKIKELRPNLGTNNHAAINFFVGQNYGGPRISGSLTLKQNALKKKSDSLLEFRLFESRADIDILCSFTMGALGIVQQAITGTINVTGGKRHTYKKIDRRRRIKTRKHRKSHRSKSKK